MLFIFLSPFFSWAGLILALSCYCLFLCNASNFINKNNKKIAGQLSDALSVAGQLSDALSVSRQLSIAGPVEAPEPLTSNGHYTRGSPDTVGTRIRNGGHRKLLDFPAVQVSYNPDTVGFIRKSPRTIIFRAPPSGV